MNYIHEGYYSVIKRKKLSKTIKNLLSQTFLDCFTAWQMQIRRKPYSQSLAQRSKQKGDFFQRFGRVWTVQLEKKSTLCFLFNGLLLTEGEPCDGVSSWTVRVPPRALA